MAKTPVNYLLTLTRTLPVPFDPRIIPVDQPPLRDDGGLQLPDDLAELAAQLADDAAFLGQRYPAQAFSQAAFEVADVKEETQLVSPAETKPVSNLNRRNVQRSVLVWLSGSLAVVCLAFVASEVWFAGEVPERVAANVGEVASTAEALASSPSSSVVHSSVAEGEFDEPVVAVAPSPTEDITSVSGRVNGPASGGEVDSLTFDAGGLELENMSTLELEAVVDLCAPEGGISF
jgi:hypothetical protein